MATALTRLANAAPTRFSRTLSTSTLPGQRIRKDTADGDPDQEKDFYILRHTSCTAVLTENLFMDNRNDVAPKTHEKPRPQHR